MNIDNTHIDYLIYARKSSEQEDRQVLSIDSQKKELLDLVNRDSLHVIGTKEEAHSAKAPGRPVFNELLDSIESGSAQGIVSWNPDRLSRNSVDTGRIIYLFDQGKLQELVTPSQVFRNTPNDKFLLSLLCSQAKLDNDNKGINVKRGLRAKCERGIYPAPAPTGYVNNKYAERGNKTIEIDGDRFHIVQKMLKLVHSQKYTPMQVLKTANEDWKFRTVKGRKLSRSGWYHMLVNPLYSGVFEYPLKSGNWYKGIHKPMITEEEYDQIQAILDQKGKQRPKTHVFAFTGIMRCGECGASITAEEKVKRQKNGNVHRYIYYHCTKRINPNCTQRSIEEKPLKKQIIATLHSIKIPPEFHDWALKWLRVQNKNTFQTTKTILKQQQTAYDNCIDSIDELIDMRAAKEISPEEFKRKKSKLNKEKKRLKSLLDDTDHNVDAWIQKAEDWLSFARDAVKKFNKGGLEDKRYILVRLGSNLILQDKILHIDWEKALLPLKEAAKECEKIHNRLEPADLADNTSQLESLYEASPRLLPGRDSNPDNQLQRLVSYH